MSRKQFTRQEVAARNHAEDAAFVIDNVVYEISGFLQEHPGGAEALLDHVGGDATQAFYDVGHSQEARELMRQYAAGELVEAERRRRHSGQVSGGGEGAGAAHPLLGVVGLPLAVAAAAALLYSYVF